ncbi:MAG: ketoacyl-ACP synthase III [Endomicrobium sp.]|jgi:3-oxoacyl-[acyl-carrier-protein] synthase-3|nr:ketoacyl-ACP synthase III [Endomicrobium sp.]
MIEKKPGVQILGTGAYFPSKVLTNSDLEKIVNTSDEWITSRTGIETRRISDSDIPTSELAFRASIEALNTAKLTTKQLDLILVATITPDMLFPSTACLLQRRLGAKGIPSFDLAAACSGFIYGISIARSFIQSGLYKTILLVGAEELSKITDWTDRTTCVLFGDGAGAMVLTASSYKENSILSTFLGADGDYSNLLYVPAGGTLHPTTNETVVKKMHTIKMEGKQVFKMAVLKMVYAAKKAIELSGLQIKDIKLFIPHQANIRIIKAVAEKLGISMQQVFINIYKTGNISSATTITALDEAIKTGKIKKGDIVELISFGSGFTWGATVIQL